MLTRQQKRNITANAHNWAKEKIQMHFDEENNIVDIFGSEQACRNIAKVQAGRVQYSANLKTWVFTMRYHCRKYAELNS